MLQLNHIEYRNHLVNSILVTRKEVEDLLNHYSLFSTTILILHQYLVQVQLGGCSRCINNQRRIDDMQ